MPMPPYFANVLAYSSVRNDRPTPPAPPPPNGPSPSMPVYIWLNIEERKADSKSTALARALASAAAFFPSEASAPISPPSCPDLFRASTSWAAAKRGVDGIGTRACPSSALLRVASRVDPTCDDKPGHDDAGDDASVAMLETEGRVPIVAITSPRSRPGWRRPP